MMKRRDFFGDESASIALTIFLSMPFIIALLGLGFDYAITSHATRSVKDNLTHAAISGTQYLYRAQGTIQPNCALGAVLTQYSANRGTVFNIYKDTSKIKGQLPSLVFGYSTAKEVGAQWSDKAPAATALDKTTQSLQSKYGFGDSIAQACDFSAVPIDRSRNKDKLMGAGKFFDTAKGIKLSGSKVTTTQPFYVANFVVNASEYDHKTGKLKKASHMTICVREFSVNQFLGRVVPSARLSSVMACSDASTFLGRTLE